MSLVYCTKCGNQVEATANYCPRCGTQRLSAPPLLLPPPSQDAPPSSFDQLVAEVDDSRPATSQQAPTIIVHQYAPPVTTRNPGVAAVLSFLWPGAGQIYNGQIAKGILFVFLQALFAVLCFVIIGIPLLLILWIWAICDAYAGPPSARRRVVQQQTQHQGRLGQSPAPPKRARKSGYWLAFFIWVVCVGGLACVLACVLYFQSANDALNSNPPAARQYDALRNMLERQAKSLVARGAAHADISDQAISRQLDFVKEAKTETQFLDRALQLQTMYVKHFKPSLPEPTAADTSELKDQLDGLNDRLAQTFAELVRAGQIADE